MMKIKDYTFQVLKTNNGYVGLCEEFPSLKFRAPVAHKALDGIQTLVKEVVMDMKRNGHEIPLTSEVSYQ